MRVPPRRAFRIFCKRRSAFSAQVKPIVPWHASSPIPTSRRATRSRAILPGSSTSTPARILWLFPFTTGRWLSVLRTPMHWKAAHESSSGWSASRKRLPTMTLSFASSLQMQIRSTISALPTKASASGRRRWPVTISRLRYHPDTRPRWRRKRFSSMTRATLTMLWRRCGRRLPPTIQMQRHGTIAEQSSPLEANTPGLANASKPPFGLRQLMAKRSTVRPRRCISLAVSTKRSRLATRF